MFPPRPDEGGRNGKSISVRTNLFASQGKLRGEIFHYDITLNEKGQKAPPSPAGQQLKNPNKPKDNREVMKRLWKTYESTHFNSVVYAYDGKSNIYTTKSFPWESQSFELNFEEDNRERQFGIEIKLVKNLAVTLLNEYLSGKSKETPQDILNALEVILGHTPAETLFHRGRSFYTPKLRAPLGNGVEAWSGYFQALRPTTNGLMMNIDVSAAAFHEEKDVIEVCLEVWRLRSPRDLETFHPTNEDIRSLKKTLHLLQVETTHHRDFKRKVRIQDLTSKNATQLTFSQDGNTISVADYFEKQYNYRLKYPGLPCLVCGKNKSSFFPLEICRVIPGQIYARKLGDTQTAAMIKFTASRPHDRLKKIEDGFDFLDVSNTPQLNDLGIKFENRMLQTPARILDTPTIQYQGSEMTPNFGAWNLRDRRFILGAKIKNWGVLVVGSDRDAPRNKVEAFVSDLVNMAQRTNMIVEDRRPPILYARDSEGDIQQQLKELDHVVRKNTGQQLGFFLCIIKGGVQTYKQIKRMSDHYIGIPSQCMLAKHIFRPNPQYIGNLLLKINGKLGGRNSQLAHELPMFDKPTIIIGADVTHPTTGRKKGVPSIVAVVGSTDRFATRYTGLMQVQPSRVEEIESLKDLICELLRRFYNANGKVKPQRIIFLRDGVSEGQFATVFHQEIQAIKAACFELQQDYAPSVTFVITQKRHHIRFFPVDDKKDKSGNVLPGTVIDTKIVNPHDFDFYLMSHSGIQGTSRPAHYHVLLDENGFTSDSLQKFVFDLCHNFARCTRSVSIPPPIYYAHLVAYRGRLLSSIDLWSGSDTESIASGEASNYQDILKPLHDNLETVMFFL